MRRNLFRSLSNPSRHGWGFYHRRLPSTPSRASLSASHCLLETIQLQSTSFQSILLAPKYAGNWCGRSWGNLIVSRCQVAERCSSIDWGRVRPSRARLKAAENWRFWPIMIDNLILLMAEQKDQLGMRRNSWAQNRGNLAAVRSVGIAMVVAMVGTREVDGELGLKWIKCVLTGHGRLERNMAGLAIATLGLETMNGGEMERQGRFWKGKSTVNRRNHDWETAIGNSAAMGAPNLGWMPESILWPNLCWRPNSVWVLKLSWVSKQSWVDQFNHVLGLQVLGYASMGFRIWDP